MIAHVSCRRSAFGLCILLAAACVATTSVDLLAQSKAPKKVIDKSKLNSKAVPVSEETAPLLEEIDFGNELAALADGATQELDETEEGQERLTKLERQAKGIFRDHDLTLSRRRPWAVERDTLLGEVAQCNQGIAQAQQVIVQGQATLNNLQSLVNDGDKSASTQNQMRSVEKQMAAANTLIAVNQVAISDRSTTINALNIQIKPLDDKLVKLWHDLNESRKQWLEIRQPARKYAHANYEALKKVIDDWLLLDSVWPDAHIWGALCDYELGNYAEAWGHVEKAAELRQSLNFSKSWPQGDALRGLIAAKLPDRKGKAAGFIQMATVAAGKDRKTSWETYFLLGRAAYENDKFAGKSKTHFEKALKSNPDAACVKYWFARLQSTTATASVRDPKSGVATLGDLWKQSTKQSWRLGHAVVLAYDAAGRESDGDQLWAAVQKLAPEEELEDLTAAREKAQSNQKSGNSAGKAKKK